MPRRSLGAVLFSIALTAGGSSAHAQSNHRLAPVGGRSTLLGGTGMVYGRDAAAAFLNPATAVLTNDNRLSFSVNFYTMSLALAPRWYRPGPTDPRFGNVQLENTSSTDFQFNALPSSLCLFLKVGSVEFLAKRIKDPNARDARLGLCFATVQSHDFNFAARDYQHEGPRFVTRQAQTVAQSFTRFAAGPTYAMNITERFSIGVSLHGTITAHRSLFSAANTSYLVNNGAQGAPFNSSFYAGSRGTAVALEPLLGATYRFGHQKVGVSLKLPSLHVFGRGGANRHSHYDDESGDETSIVTSSGSFIARAPMRLGLGTGAETSWGSFEFNTSISAGSSAYEAEFEGRRVVSRTNTLEDREVKESLSERLRGVVNASLGAEVFVSRKISALGGLATDISALSKGSMDDGLFNYHPARTHRLATSFGLASHGDGGELLIGSELSVGWGERLAVNSYRLPPELHPTGHTTFQMMFVIAGSTSLRALKRAVTDVTKVLTDQEKEKEKERGKPAPTTPSLSPEAPAK